MEDSTFTGPSHTVFANRRTVRFNEMEYTVPAEDGIACLEEVCDTLRQEDINVFFPIEFRYVAEDDRLLSMYHQRPGASLSIHQYFAQDYEGFQPVEPICAAIRAGHTGASCTVWGATNWPSCTRRLIASTGAQGTGPARADAECTPETVVCITLCTKAGGRVHAHLPPVPLFTARMNQAQA